MDETSNFELERRLRSVLAVERDPATLERISSALAELLRSMTSLEEAEAGARFVLDGGNGPPTGKLKLHEAIARVLADQGRPMRTAEISEAIKRRGLYFRKDGNPPGTAQVSARVNNYDGQFRKLEDGRIWLRKDAEKVNRNVRVAD